MSTTSPTSSASTAPDPHPPPHSGPAGRRHRSLNPIARYTRWLHTQWPAGTVEQLPEANQDGSTKVPGLYITGDLTGIPLLKFSADTGAKAVRTILNDPTFTADRRPPTADFYDLLIIGAGVSGMAAALEARKHNLNFQILESAEPFNTIVNFPKAKPIYTYPTDMTPAGDLQFRAQIKEDLVDELRAQTKGITPTRARVDKVTRAADHLEVQLTTDNGPRTLSAKSVIVAIGRSGNHRKLNVPGEDSGKVFNRLHDPKDYASKHCLVVGAGDSALETAIALSECGALVALSYRSPEISRAKPENIDKLNRLIADPAADVQIEKPKSERTTTAVGGYMGDYRKPGRIVTFPASHVKQIRDDAVLLTDASGNEVTLKNDVVFTMIGREAPLDFFRRSGVPVRGDRTATWWITLLLFLAFCFWMYHWKKSGVHITGVQPVDHVLDIGTWWQNRGWFPSNVPAVLGKLGQAWRRPTNLLGVINTDLAQPGFYYSFAYCACVVGFGIDRVRRKRTPYVKYQTLTLATIQCLLLFLLPYVLLPWAGHNGWFQAGTWRGRVADHLFEPYDALGHDRAYWRSFGFVLAWPLFFYNVFTDQPMWTWLIISIVQTLVLIPALVYFWGKGAYCGWICSCGALAETLGDRHRQKMPHGPFWNRFNMVGQAFLAFAVLLLGFRVTGWIAGPNSRPDRAFHYLFESIPVINYKWFVDLLWAGIIGVGMYFWFSGRVWCRFACPLAALMHIYARFSRFRILADKKKCISCNVCTSVCHQGIDVMNFANKGLPMADPECVRCSACVQSCPTGVLSFGQIDPKTGKPTKTDPKWLEASPVHLVELHIHGKPLAH